MFPLLQEIILKRAADLAEALYSMPPRAGAHSQLALPSSRSPAAAMNSASGFNTYAGQLAQVDSANGQWDDAWSHRYPAFTF